MQHDLPYRPSPSEIPTKPGVYRFADTQGRVIYVGKAINLRSRINSYFQKFTNLAPRIQRMVSTARSVEWTIVQNELEALTLEYTWITEFAPKYNVQFRDDKSYPYLAISVQEEVPRVYITRERHRKGVRYLGPFAHVWALRETFDLLLRIFPVRSCSRGVFDRAVSSQRPCLLGHIGKCAAPCVGWISQEEHRTLINGFMSVMGGNVQTLERDLKAQMLAAAEAEEFEVAATKRDQLAALATFAERNAVVFSDGTDADVLGIAVEPLVMAVEVFGVREGRIRHQRGFILENVEDLSSTELLNRFVQQYYGALPEEEKPREILSRLLPAHTDTLTRWLSGAQRPITLRTPQRGDKYRLLTTADENAAESLRRYALKRANDLDARTAALNELQEFLGLSAPPLRIECIDISHTQGEEIVGSLVVFEDGAPKRKDYRRFVLQPEGEQLDDTRSIAQVVRRRFARMNQPQAESNRESGLEQTNSPEVDEPRQSFAYAPELLLIDGGPAQVNAAAAALAEVGGPAAALTVVGIAKRLEELWFPYETEPLILPRSSEGLYLVQRVRDEAHRFAIEHHRARRRKKVRQSVLDTISGIGPARKKALLKEFGSVKAIKQATVEQLSQVPGIGQQAAQRIHAALDQQAAPAPAMNVTTGEILDEG